MLDPSANDVRALSEEYGISIKRIDAILRLKGLEANMEKVGLQSVSPFTLSSVCRDELQTISLEDQHRG